MQFLQQFQMQEPTILVTCENCLKQMAQQKLNTHFGYCHRNIKKCQQCQQMYDINLKEQHEEEYHKVEKCVHCDKLFSINEIERHKKQCAPRMKQCIYCDLNVPEVIFDEHLRICQSRTVTCEICGNPVVNKFLKKHDEECFNNLCANYGKAERKQRNPYNYRDEYRQWNLEGRKRVKQDQYGETKPKSIFKTKTEKKAQPKATTTITNEKKVPQIVCLDSEDSNKSTKGKQVEIDKESQGKKASK